MYVPRSSNHLPSLSLSPELPIEMIAGTRNGRKRRGDQSEVDSERDGQGGGASRSYLAPPDGHVTPVFCFFFFFLLVVVEEGSGTLLQRDVM